MLSIETDSILNLIYKPSLGTIDTDTYFPIDSPFEKERYARHLRDSAERLKIMSHCLMNQAEEIEKFGYPKTQALYYNADHMTS